MIAITDRKEYKANASIKIISDKEADKIIETREPRGLFVYAENGLIVRCDNRTEILCEVGAKIIGIDNRTGDAWTEEFDTYEDCVKWLIDPDREAGEPEPTEEDKRVKRALEFVVDEFFTAVAVTAIRLIVEACEEEADTDTATEAMERIAEHDGTADKMARGE